MVMRISENMKFNTIVDNMYKSQDSYNKLAEKVASQKGINRPSDDPIGMNKVLNLRKSKASIEQYTRNIDGCESWLTITESKLSAAGDILLKAREVAVGQSTATASAETRSAEAETVKQIIDQMLALANSKYGGRYLFSGAKTEETPFSSTERTDSETGDALEADGNTFNGTVASSGVYSGTENKTYVVKIVDGGALDIATYRVSDDGGKTWSEPPSTMAATITLGDDIDLTFTTGTNNLTTDDIFYVQALAAPTVTVEDQPVGNGFVGTVEVSSVPANYSGTENKTYVVKIIYGGALDVATYQVSDDDGVTWGDEEIDLNTGTITLGDDIDLTFTVTDDLTTGDTFSVQAHAASGYYNGNGEEMSVNIDENTPFAYSISGEAAFTDKGKGIFDVLNRLKSGLENNEPDEIALCIEDLKAASDQISKNISKCGTRMNRLEIAKSNFVDLDSNLTQLLSDTEDADMAELITRLAMKETTLKASYVTASKIGNLTILDYLR